MIYTVTFNPSIDCVVYLDSFTNGMTNRTTSEEYYIGGKGINVSYVLSELDIKNTALGFSAGFTGDAIEKELKTKGIAADFIRLKNGISRINFKIKTDKESEINCQGPKIGEDEFRKLIEKMDMITDGDTLVLAGSIPNTFSSDAYEKIIKKLDGKDVRVVVDAEKRFLLDLLKYKPFLIKPNRQELCEIFDAEIEDETDIELYARKLREMGAKNVLVSVGGDGAMLIDEFGEKHRTGALKEKPINTVGSGDSMVAGFIAGYERTKSYSYALSLGSACGNATAYSKGLATKEKIDEILNKLQ